MNKFLKKSMFQFRNFFALDATIFKLKVLISSNSYTKYSQKKRWIFIAVLFCLRPLSLYVLNTDKIIKRDVLFYYALSPDKERDTTLHHEIFIDMLGFLKRSNKQFINKSRIYKLSSHALVYKRMSICDAFKFQTSGLFCPF